MPPARHLFPLRWNDNDQYGHMNNTIYYEAMDTAINTWLIRSAGLDPAGETIGLCVASSCEFHSPAAYPEELVVEVGVGRTGRTSITWELRILRSGGSDLIAVGSFTHVFVNATTRRPVPIPHGISEALADLRS